MKFCNLLILLAASVASFNIDAKQVTSDYWKNATVYFMLTDRFNNGDKTNDKSYGRIQQAAKLRGFEGGDIKGVIQKLQEGYFEKLGVSALWMTPVIEQIHGYDELDGKTYAYHGYWPKDWTSIDANFGTEEDLQELITEAHKRGIKILVDVIVNHTGPKTKKDWAWPNDWIRTRPLCDWSSFEQNTKCALAESLTDIKTELEEDVKLPKQLLEKWQREERLQTELQELDSFFSRTGYPRAPKYYIVKWLTDWVREYGIDGFRVDTVKHVEPGIWQVLKTESKLAFQEWKRNHPEQVMDDLPFYMVGEVYNWGLDGFSAAVSGTREYDFGDKKVDFFNYGFDALINMGFVSHISEADDKLFSRYSDILNNGEMSGKGVLNYIGSHDDHNSFDRERQHTYDTAFKLMMSPGAVQIYYGDEIARPMIVEDAFGDASMRASIDWSMLSKPETQALLAHWQKLGQFRKQHRAVGAGTHTQLNKDPYIFKRELGQKDAVIIGKGMTLGIKAMSVHNVFENGQTVKDYYSGKTSIVKNGKVTFDSPYSYLLLGRVE